MLDVMASPPAVPAVILALLKTPLTMNALLVVVVVNMPFDMVTFVSDPFAI